MISFWRIFWLEFVSLTRSKTLALLTFASGGAGGFIEARDVVLAAGQYTVTVGGGGVSTVATLCGGNGGNTEIVSPAGSTLYSALGGSGGTSWSSAAQSSPGGSGFVGLEEPYAPSAPASPAPPPPPGLRLSFLPPA